MRREAFQIAENVAEEKVQEWVKGGYVASNPERPDESRNNLKRLALYSVQHLVQQAVKDREIPQDMRSLMRKEMQKVNSAISAAEIMQSMQRSGLGFPMTTTARGTKGFLRFDLDELHFRAVLAALIGKNGPLPTDQFVFRLALFNKEVLTEHADAFLKAPLGKPTKLGSGSQFAELAMKAFQEGSSSAWEMLAEPEPVGK